MFNVIWLVQFLTLLRSQWSLSSISAKDFEANNKTISSTFTFSLGKRDESELRQNSAKIANFGEQIANFRFRRKLGEISAHIL